MDVVKKDSKKRIIIIAVIVVIIAIAAIVILGQVRKQKEIKEGVEIGNRYLSQLNYEEAIACFKQVLEIDPKNREVNHLLADAYIGKEEYVYAENIYLDLIKEDKKEPQAYIDLTELYIKIEKLEEAKAVLEEAKQNMENEEIDAFASLLNPAVPMVSHQPGVYTERIRLELIPEDESQRIYYTLDGSEPSEEALEYTKPLILKNGVTTIKAFAVNSLGYRSEMAEYSYDTRIEDIIVTIEEPVIVQLLRNELNISYMDPIYNDDIEQITELYIVSDYYIGMENNNKVTFQRDQYQMDGYPMTPYSDGCIKTLNDLKNMPFLETVAIEFQKELDFQALAECKSITKLSLMGNNLDLWDIEAIAGLTQLEKLNLGWNEITDITALSGLTNLTSLSIWGNTIQSLQPITGCQQLLYLDFADNQVTDISVLSGLQTLQQLWMYQNQITDISAVAAMERLQVLMLRDNPIENPETVRPIYAHLTRLDVDLLGLGDDAE